MSKINKYNSGAEYARHTKREYPSVSLVYDDKAPSVIEKLVEGVFIETTDGKLVKKEDWKSSYVPNNIYISDGLRKVRLALEWCNENNCDAYVASSDRNNDPWKDHKMWDNHDLDSAYGEDWCRSYRWTCGVDEDHPVVWNEVVDGISIYNSYDWEGKKNTDIIAKNVNIEEFPAFHAARTYLSPNGEKGYLMGISEWQMCYKYKDEIAAIDDMLGLTEQNWECEVGCPWSSSLYGGDYAWILDTDNYGGVGGYGRYSDWCVRAAF